MKKYLALVLSVLMIFIVVSCGSDTDVNGKQSSEEITEETTEEITEETTEETTEEIIEETTEEITGETTEEITEEVTEEITEETTEETTEEVTEETTGEVTEETTEETIEEDTGDEAFEELDMTLETIPSNNSDGYSFIRMNDQTSSTPQQHMSLLPAKQMGIHFKIDKGILEAVVLEGVPSWGDNIGGFTVKIFKWNTDYNTTVAGKPITQKVLDNIPDMGEAVFEPDVKIVAGEYLFLISDPFDESGTGIGICNQTGNVNDPGYIEGFINGKANSKVGPTGYFVIYHSVQ